MSQYIKRSDRLAHQVWAGQCTSCGFELEAPRHELDIQTNCALLVEKGLADCPNCKKPKAAIFYPKSEE